MRAYVDDSGSPDQDGGFLCMAGWAAPADNWRAFEDKWASVLRGHGAPYLHMKEFGDPNGLYASIKSDPQKEKEFIGGLVDTIHECGCVGFGASVKLPDLQQFNDNHGLNLDPYSIAIYFAVRQLCFTIDDQNQPFEFVLDKFDKAHHRWDKAMDFLNSDMTSAPFANGLMGSPITGSQSFKDILPLQAADFLAWEMRKSCEEASGWNPGKEVRWSAAHLSKDYADWSSEHKEITGSLPRNARGSFVALAKGIETESWSVVLLQDLEEVSRYHLNGWP